MGGQRRLFGAAVAAGLLISTSAGAIAAETAGLYQAYWAGLPAGDIRLILRDDPTGYRDEIAIRSEGLAWLFTKFRGTATAEGRLAARGLWVVPVGPVFWLLARIGPRRLLA